MRGAALGLALLGCNQVFGLPAAELVDASAPLQDAPVDAAPSCPPIGTPLRFGSTLVQAVNQFCHGYTPSYPTRSALATCQQPAGYVVSEGRLDDRLGPARGLEGTAGVTFINAARLVPEGSEAFANVYENATGAYKLYRYTRDTDGAWIKGAEQTTPFPVNQLGSVTRGPMRRVMVQGTAAPYLRELVAQNDSWTEVGQYNFTDFGVQTATSLTLTADGLRVLFVGYMNNAQHMMYAERAEVSARFGIGMVLEGVPVVQEMYLTEDCDRVYFSGLNSVFYSTRIP